MQSIIEYFQMENSIECLIRALSLLNPFFMDKRY